MNRTALSELLSSCVEGLGAELDDLDVVPAGKRRLVRVTVDGDGQKGSGLSLDEIAQITTEVSRVLDESNAMGERPYTLEVTTRGVSTPLRRPAHYRRNVGRLVTLWIDDQQISGRIVAADEESVTMTCENEQRTYALDTIAKAIVQVEMNRSESSEEN